MKTFKFVAAVVAVALTSLGIGTAVATVHPHLGASYEDNVSVDTYCANSGGNPVVIAEMNYQRSDQRTSTITLDLHVEYDYSGNHYSGTPYTNNTISPGGTILYFVQLTDDGPKTLTDPAGTEITTATNIEMSLVRHSDSELQYYGRSRNRTTACT